MNEVSIDGKVQALIVPLRQQNLIIPQSALVEVLPMPDLRPVDAKAPWILGSLDWRHHDVPLISLERYCDWVSADATRTRRVAIIKGLSGYKGLEHFAIETQGIPHPIRLGESDVIQVDPGGQAPCDAIAMHVQAAGIRAVIARLEVFERQLRLVMEI